MRFYIFFLYYTFSSFLFAYMCVLRCFILSLTFFFLCSFQGMDSKQVDFSFMYSFVSLVV